MPILANPRHELFAQERAKGLSYAAAYVAAGFKPHTGNAYRLSQNESVKTRVAEILQEAAERSGVTVDRVINELAKIGFADIRRVVKWGESVAVRQEDGGDAIVAHDVALLSSAAIDDDIAGAIAEIRKTKEGLSIKMHDKRAALVDLGKHLGMFVEKIEHSGSLTLERLITESYGPKEGE